MLYLGAASGTSVSHVSDIVGKEGAVYAVEFSHRSGARRLHALSILKQGLHVLTCATVWRGVSRIAATKAGWPLGQCHSCLGCG